MMSRFSAQNKPVTAASDELDLLPAVEAVEGKRKFDPIFRFLPHPVAFSFFFLLSFLHQQVLPQSTTTTAAAAASPWKKKKSTQSCQTSRPVRHFPWLTLKAS